jgi:hypothetical protein
VEAFDTALLLGDTAMTSKTLGLSTRGQVGQGSQVLIMGFVVRGRQPRQFLINAKGSSLAEFGVKTARCWADSSAIPASPRSK